MSSPSYVIGVDVGGTFTDLFFYDQASGRSAVAKVPSTRGDQAVGFMEGIARQVAEMAEVATVVHGTTVGTNALLERKGAPTGIITTAGFRDVLEMRRRDRRQTWGLWGEFEPVVPRDRRLEVAERTLADGSVLEPVDLDGVRAAARSLRERGAEAAAIIFINAYANPENEAKALAALAACWPNAHVSASHEILPEIREFERASTTALNAYLQPVVGAYLKSLDDRLRAGGFKGQLLIVQSNGGVMSVGTAGRYPVRTALSGPAAGVIACAEIAAAAGFPDVITCDMGGTSFDVSLIAGGQSALAAQTAIDFGMVVRTPMIEIVTIGAGGGSVAAVDRGGMLQVGPQSAGSDPGPVCYGLGGTRPTVTDANLVLGRINAERPIGGKLARLDVEAARAALLRDVGRPLGLTAEAAAEAVIRIANARMAGAIRLVSIERGHDPERFAAMPFGGGGALHVGALIKEVGLARALVPRYPGVTSAFGCVIADMRHDFVQTLNAMLDGLDLAALNGHIERLSAEGRQLLDSAGVSLSAVETVIELDMSYLGQTHTVTVPIPAPATREGIAAAFDATYRSLYGRLLQGIARRVLNLKLAVIGRRPKLDPAILAPGPDASLEAARAGSRPVHVGGAWHQASLWHRLALPVGAVIEGPAVLEQPDTTIFIEPDLKATVDRFGNLVIERR
ncbi:MAG: hydantoinase/oxoprolinase family protein [Thalassobaculales bacterium]